ncbi:unnamed protein product [Rotaria magnacalcarata]|uniref:Uncharacterized protein n=1 Tax=Rotaria magnacalcarata TaxID=392030 RepID=A0A820UU09_9BILA|nr:unnamed protein product [Rotaria magnacalcarata]CAF2171645.1 unnamed protein product [Rotaria magnacalcarata]CAF3930648.1 unnamed protein product [Rotaria magnacalcarata]CAF4490669.1 unnamed protein product [Rotaria magnacalcarata]CAF5219414.1 unnamed protein product [Rotaria magnacalcarata]
MVLNADSQYTVIDDDRGFVQIIRAHDLQPVYAYPQCDASCLIVLNVNVNVFNQPRCESRTPTTNIQ